MTFEELSESFLEHLEGRIVAVDHQAGVSVIRIQCLDWNPGRELREFDLEFSEVVEADVLPSECGSIYACDEHPLLWDHNQQQASMFFSSVPKQPFELLGRIYQAHERLLEGWRPLSSYFSAGFDRMKVGYGLFAQGPQRVMEAYSEAVSGLVLDSIVPGHTPRGGKQVVFFDKQFVICREVSVIERSSESPPGRFPAPQTDFLG